MSTLSPNENPDWLTDQVLATLPTAILVVDGDGRYTFANEAACRLLGRPLAEIIGLTANEISADGFDVQSAWSSFTMEGHQEGEFPIKRPDGTVVSARFTATTDLVPGRHVSILHDVSDRKRLETQLRHNEELFLKAFLASPAPTNIRHLENGMFVEVNEAFTQATGYWRSDVIGGTARTLGLWKDPSQLEDLLARLRNGEATVSTRAELTMKDRSQKEFSVSMKRVEIHGEAHVVAVYTDMAAL